MANLFHQNCPVAAVLQNLLLQCFLNYFFRKGNLGIRSTALQQLVLFSCLLPSLLMVLPIPVSVNFKNDLQLWATFRNCSCECFHLRRTHCAPVREKETDSWGWMFCFRPPCFGTYQYSRQYFRCVWLCWWFPRTSCRPCIRWWKYTTTCAGWQPTSAWRLLLRPNGTVWTFHACWEPSGCWGQRNMLPLFSSNISGCKVRRKFERCTVGHKSHDPCFHVFLMEARVMTFVVNCTAFVFHLSSPSRAGWQCKPPYLTQVYLS